MEKLKVLIVDDIEETRENVRTMLMFEERIEIIAEAENGEDAVFIAKEKRPDVVLMDINMPIMDGIKATNEITLNIPECVVIIMSVQGENEYMRKAMSAGARDFLVKPFTGDGLIDTILKTYQLETKRREVTVSNFDDHDIKPKIITVFSTKGGVGKTTIASNLAVSIARKTRKKVALIDLDLQFGDIAIMLNVNVKNTINDLIKDLSQIEEEQIMDYMVTHFSGVNVLPAPVKPEYAEYITSSHVEKIIKFLKNNFNYVIIDTSASFHETVLTSLDMSDEILYVSTLDLPTIKSIKTGLDIMENLNYSSDKIKIILNKASEHFGIKFKDFEETLKHSIWAYVPDDSQTVISSANKGFPFVMTRTETKVAKAVINIANELTAEVLKNDKGKNNRIFKKIFAH